MALFTPDDAARAQREAFARSEGHRLIIPFVRDMLREARSDWSDVSRVVIDRGPGAFTAVRVGATFAKVLAYERNINLGSISAFDLLSVERTAFIGARGGRVWVRRVGQEAQLLESVPKHAVGYANGVEGFEYPHASRYQSSLARVEDPAFFVPHYVSEPSISVPNLPLARVPPR